mmetsp:Transcript_1184/g.4995  ORF Transcript_1184/g.4995 Transcript_1184/m.4995 type:complete len:373 (+) Transcript_1184:88-1206(+)
MRQRRAGRLGATLLLAQICCSSKVFSLQMALSGGVNVNTARVNVCTNRWCKEKGSGATLASFIGLIPDDNVLVSGVGCLGKCNKGPNIQIMHRNGTWYELNRVDSVDKVYRILTDHLQCRVSPAAAECLQHNFEGNAHLDRNEVTQAIASYNKAIDAGFKDQEGVILVMRSTAYLQRAFSHRIDVRNTLDRNADFQKMEAAIIAAFTAAMELPYWTNTMLRLILSIGEAQAETYHNLKLHHGLYEFAVLQATDDAVRATQLLPNYSKCWLRAGMQPETAGMPRVPSPSSSLIGSPAGRRGAGRAAAHGRGVAVLRYRGFLGSVAGVRGRAHRESPAREQRPAAIPPPNASRARGASEGGEGAGFEAGIQVTS